MGTIGMTRMEEDFFGKPPQKRTRANTWEERETKPIDLEAIKKFFDRDLLTILWQGPIKRTPKMNNREKIEEPNTPEMDAQIKELFWENHEQIIR